MSTFNLQRFAHGFRSDLATNLKAIGVAMLAFIGIGTLIYLTNVSSEPNNGMNTADFIFAIALVFGGLLVTSLSWSDMHHPLGRFQMLMLPIGALERFVARYLLTGPLFCLYCIAAFKLFELVANALCRAVWDAQMPPMQLASESSQLALGLFFTLQPLAFAGAIRFRSYAFARTALFCSLVYVALMLISAAAVRILYWNYFDSLFGSVGGPIPMMLMADLHEPPLANLLLVAADLWVLYLAWLFLNDHEVQDGL